MYRHFAAITIASTALLAIFADGESRAAVTETIKEDQHQRAVQLAKTAKFGTPKLVRAKGSESGSRGTFGEDPGVFGAPLASIPESGYGPALDSYGVAVAPSASGSEPIDYAALGLTREEFERLTPTQQQSLLARLRQRQQEMSADLLAKSAARSGRSLDY